MRLYLTAIYPAHPVLKTCRFAHNECLKRIEPELVLEETLKLLNEKNQTEA